jgi:general secretion pathway protein D
MTKRLHGLHSLLLVTLALGAAGCAASQAFSKGETAAKKGDLDAAVSAYRDAVHAAPDNPNYKIALQRAQQTASRAHIEKAKDFEAHDQLEAALGEYRTASEYDPSNRMAVAKTVELDRTIKERIEAARPKPAIQQMRERARQQSAEPILNPASREPINVRINNQSLRDALTSLGAMTGINFTFDREVADRSTTIALDGVTLEQALNQIMTMNQLSYKVLSERSIFVFPDTAPKHAQYDEQVIRTFYLSHADSTEVMQILSTIIRLPGIAVQPAIAGNKTANTITVRGTSSVVQILEKIIEQNDKPRAEIVVDVEIMEVDRTRTKNYGLELTDYSLGAIFSPEVNPSGSTASTGTGTGTTGGGTTTTATGTSTAPSAVKSPPPFNLNTISRGISTADFYMAVPAAIVHFMEGDSRTKIIAKPQLRGAEGAKLTLKLGSQIPIISTSYTPIATGGAGVNPLSSYQYKDVGVNIDMTPTVTLEGEIRLDLTVDSSSRGADVTIGGVNIPSFVQRTATTRLRLRDGESNLLAGLYSENDQSQITGFPGAIHVPLLTQLFSHNTGENDQLDIVMLLTPHIVRTHEITVDDLKPIYIGSQQNLGIGGPQQLFMPGAPDAPAIQPQAPAAPPAGPGTGFLTPTPPNPIATGPVAGRGPGGTVVSAPPGSSPVPGTVLVQPAPNTAIVTGPPGQPVVIPADPNAAAAAQPDVPPATPPATTPPATGAVTPPRDTLPTTSQGVGSAQVLISPPGTAFRVGSTYTVPISISDATRISTITLTLLFDPAKLRVNRVSEGSFMRAGGVNVTFSQQVSGNRVDITLTRGADTTGATGTGLLAAILFDAIAPGSATLTLSGSATGPGGTAMGLRFTPVTVQVQ